MCKCGRYETTHLYPAHSTGEFVLGFILVITSLCSERNIKATVWVPTVHHRGAGMSWSKGGLLSFDVVLFFIQQHLCLNSPSLNKLKSSFAALL